MKLKVIQFKQNQGLGKARNASLIGAGNELIATMDSDDIAVNDRFERQLAVFQNEQVSVVGGQITEFEGKPTNITGIRAVPQTNEQIYEYLKRRCPFNHMTVMFKKSDVITAGGYQDWHYNEDYYLWVRMAELKMKFRNLPDVLVNARTGQDMFKRRGGWKYFKSERRLQGYMLQKKMIGFPQYIVNVCLRFGVQVICPNHFRRYLFRLSRKRMMGGEHNAKIAVHCTDYPKFSVVMSVYGKDNPQYFDDALKSIVEQTIPPDEIVLVVDGPVPLEIEVTIEKYKKKICSTQLVENQCD